MTAPTGAGPAPDSPPPAPGPGSPTSPPDIGDAHSARSPGEPAPLVADAGGPAEKADAHSLRRRVIWRLLAVAFVAAAATTLTYALTVGTRLGQLMGELILGGRTGSPEAILAAEDVLEQLSRSAVAAGVVVVVAIALVQRRPALAVVAGASVLGANLTTFLLKAAVLDRSDLLDGLFYFLPNSFPSGHVTAVASVAVALVLVLPPILRSPATALAAILVALVGASTLLAGWHRMADAIGGVFVATGWAAALTALLVWRRDVEPVGRRTASFARLLTQIPILLGLVILLLGALAYVIALADPLGILLLLAERGGSPALLVVGVLITIGTSFLALGAFGLAIRDVRLDPGVEPAAAGPPA